MPIGRARVALAGEKLWIITYGAGVHWALDLANANPQWGIEVVDLRTLLPLDYEAIESTVRKTGRILILHEDTLLGGIGSEDPS